MDAIAPRAAPVACLPVAAGIVVSIQIMPPAISVWNRAGRLGRQPRPEPARLVSPNQSAAHPNKAACSHVAAAGSDRQIIAIRAAHIAPQKTAETHSASCADSPGRATAAWRETCGGEDRGEHPPGRERRDHHGCWS